MLLTISVWWEGLITIQKIYWSIAIPFSLLFIFQLILTFVGGDVDGLDADGDADMAIDSDTGIDFQFITLKNLIAFFTIFGWTGIAGIEAGYTVGKSVIIATIAGVVMMSIMAAIVYFMGKLTDSGTLNINNAIGHVGSVYLTIPANRKSMGKVQINVQGLRTLDAMTDYEEDIPTGGVVDVIDVLNNEILLVKPSGK